MGETTVTLHSHEEAQLQEFLPKLKDKYTAISGGDEDRINEMLTLFNHLQTVFDSVTDGPTEYTLTDSEWQDLTLALEELSDTRAGWLEAKIGRRAEVSPAAMGFTSSVPFMTLMTGETPTQPE